MKMSPTYSAKSYAILANFRLSEGMKEYITRYLGYKMMHIDSIIDIPFKAVQSTFPYKSKFEAYSILYNDIQEMPGL